MRIVVIIVTVLLLVIGWGWINIWRSPAHAETTADCHDNQKILTMSEYGEVGEHARPYLVEEQDLVIFGAEHTKNPDDTQMELIRESWQSLKPTVALVEGRLGFLIPYAMDPVAEFGEGGLVGQLAKANGTELFTWDMPKSDLVTRLLDYYQPEQIALLQVLNPYFSNYRFGPPDDPNQYVSAFLYRSGYPGLNNVISSVSDIDRIWKRDFSEYADWRKTSDQYGLPGYLAEIASTANLIRNQLLICLIEQYRARGERLFVICGSSHAVCVEPAI